MGVGVYARSQNAAFLSRFRIVALHGSQVGHTDIARTLKNPLRSLWLYSTPEYWYPNTWQATLENYLAQVASLGLDGIIADPETGWGGHDADAVRLGAALAAASSQCRIGVTSFPAFGPLQALADACEGKVFGSPQIYGNVGAANLARWYGRWTSAFGKGRVLASICASDQRITPDTAPITTEAAYKQYLSDLPASPGYLGWTTGSSPEWIFSNLGSAGPFLGRNAAKALAALRAPVSLALVVIFIVAFAAWAVHHGI